MSEPIPKLKTLLWRGMRKKCPQCGQGDVFKRFTTLNDRCSVCGLEFLENQGDLWGYLVLVDRALFLFPLVVVIYFRVYSPNSAWCYLYTAALIFAFFYTLPHRNSISLAIDYLVRRKSGQLPDPESPKQP